jgi:hypothetical protein
MRTTDHLEEYRIRASLLMKDLRAPDPAMVRRAARRFRILPALAGRTLAEIAANRDGIRRKHALAVIAREAGFETWLELRTGFDTTRLFRGGAFLNLWYKHYDEAREVLGHEPKRYLFPYQRQFVVCESTLLEDRGIDTTDPDWERIGRDWANPGDRAAHARLTKKLKMGDNDRAGMSAKPKEFGTRYAPRDFGT